MSNFDGIPAEDWVAMHNAVMDYAAGIDTLDMDLFRTVFTEDVLLTYGEDWAPMKGIDALVSFVDPFHRRLNGTHHQTTNFRVSAYDGTTATTHCSVAALLLVNDAPGGDWFVRHGFYIDKWTRTADGWKIHHRDFRPLFDTGNLSILEFEWEPEG